MPVLPKGALRPAGAHDQAHSDAGDHAIQVGAPRQGLVNRAMLERAARGANPFLPGTSVCRYPRKQWVMEFHSCKAVLQQWRSFDEAAPDNLESWATPRDIIAALRRPLTPGNR